MFLEGKWESVPRGRESDSAESLNKLKTDS